MKKFATVCFALMFVLVVATGCPAKPAAGDKKAGAAAAGAKDEHAGHDHATGEHHDHDGHDHGAAAATSEDAK